ncbi:MAG: leucyl aminopeptidase [Pseudomonadota bacterium]
MKVTFSKAAPPKSAAMIVLCTQTDDFGEVFSALNEDADGALKRAAKAGGFTGRKDQFVEILTPAGLDQDRIVLAGVGDVKDFTLHDAETLGGGSIARLLKTSEKSAAFLIDGLAEHVEDIDVVAAHIAYGATLRAYRFDKYKASEEKDAKPALSKVSLHGAGSNAKKAFADLSALADGVALCRDLVSEPANILYPETFADRCRELEALGVKVTILTAKDMQKLGMGSLLGVAQGSVREARLVAMEWSGGDAKQKPIALVGKGVTFDTGGISLKPAPGMEDMKWDMGGAAAVTGAMSAIAGRQAKANVVGVIGLVENMPDGNAQRPGDVVTSMSGKTIEVLNTDAEGRLVLADAVWWTQEKYKPSTLIDLATLTGAVIISLGHEYAGLFTEDDALADELGEAAKSSGDKIWRLPLAKTHYDMIKCDIADMKNIGGREAGSSTAAAFIGNFIKDGVRWAHLDIAGMAWSKKATATIPKGGVGYGVRLLDAYVRETIESD